MPPKTSETLPTEYGLTTRIGRFGKLSCALAVAIETTIISNAVIIAPRRFVIAVAYPALPAVFKRSACSEDADNPPAGQGLPWRQPEPLATAGFRAGMVIAATPMTTQASPIQAVGESFSPSSRTPSATPIGTRR